jgi:hypothetical protein
MRPSLHCLGEHIAIPVGGINGISLPLLLQSKMNTAASNHDDNIKPRTLFTRAREVVKTGKKALACVMAPDSRYKDNIKMRNLPSGMNHDDDLQFVQEKMYFVLNPSKQCDDVSADKSSRDTTRSTTTDADSADISGDNHDCNEAQQVVEAAKLFTFSGYIIFTLMGPIVEDFDMRCHQSDQLMTSTPTFNNTAQKKLAGKRRARQLQEAKHKRQRLSDNNGDYDDDDTSSNLLGLPSVQLLKTANELCLVQPLANAFRLLESPCQGLQTRERQRRSSMTELCKGEAQ